MRQRSLYLTLLVLVITGIAGYLYSEAKYQYGLDVKGGIRLTYEMDDSKLSKEQRVRLPEIKKQLINILTNRVSQSLGVVEGNVQQKGANKFIVELPGFTDAEKARRTLSTTASIRFYHAKTVTTHKAQYRRYEVDGDEQVNGSPVVYFRVRNNPSKILKPGDPDYIRMIEGWDLILQGDDLKRASEEMRGSNHYIPLMEFSREGARKMENWSRKVLNRGEMLAAVLDNQVLSIAPIKENTILSDNSVIDGQFDVGYVQGLVRLLNGGALPVDLKEVSSSVVDPTIGKHALDKMILAGVISFGVICAFLLAYYMFPGIVAILSLVLYVLFTLTVLKLLSATFSLAAIAGIILSVGMAVDANILVFERVKEEMRNGKALMAAIELGFKRALPAIIDSNACTIITSLVLLNLGSGSVKGFASTLIIGLLISFFTAITVTRSLLMLFVSSGLGNNPKYFALGRQWFGEHLEKTADHKPLQIVGKARKYFGISVALIVPGVFFVLIGGLKPNVEFQGGYEAVYEMNSDQGFTSNQILKNLEQDHILGATVKLLSNDQGQHFAYVTVPPLMVKGNLEVIDTKAVQTRVAKASGFSIEQERSFTEIGPTVQRETIQNAILAIIIGCGVIIIYLAIRFGAMLGGVKNGFKFGASAIGALVHDVILVLGLGGIFGYFLNWEVSMLFLTAMLTVIGFSVHDTIVIFDRVRENLKRPSKEEDFENLCNRSITQSFARSINTSATVILTLVVLFFIGATTPDLKFFCLAMLLGVITGTYSSLYNATPILYLWDRAIGKRKGEKETLLAEARREQERARAAAVAMQQEAQTYGQVRRKNSAVDHSKHFFDNK